jgi:RHS repeat-associated protein
MANEITVNATTVRIEAKQSGVDTIHYLHDDGAGGTIKVSPERPAHKDFTTCEVIRVVNSALDKGYTIRPEESTIAALIANNKHCPTDKLQWPPNLAQIDPNENPAAKDGPPPPNTTLAHDTGAPSPDPTISVSLPPIPPGVSDGRSLNEQRNDPARPLQDYDVAGQLTSQGVPASELADQVQSVLRNEPPLGDPHPKFSEDDRTLHTTTADPIVLFTGQFTIAVADVEVPSRGFPLRLLRTYHSGEPYYGPWGYNWDHSYNVYLRPLSSGALALWTGQLREEIYRPAGPLQFEPPLGVFRLLERLPAATGGPERFVLSDLEGFQSIFFVPPGWSLPDRIPLMELRDRHGNSHSLIYDGEGHLGHVRDHAGRFVRFHYGANGLVEQVEDHTGRTWQYFHDSDIEHLVAVRSPATHDFPDGVRTNYQYARYESHPLLQHNIVVIRDSDNRVLLENEYGIDPASDNFGRLRFQVSGGFVTQMCSTRLQFVPRLPDAINVPALRVEANEGGLMKVYTFNYRGDLLDERFRLTRDGSLRVCARVNIYDKQGNRNVERAADGRKMLYTYDVENQDPRARGNLLKVEISAPWGSPVSSRILERRTYEPKFHRLKTRRDEAGKLTTFFYDYEDVLGNRGDVVRVEYPVATLPDGSGQVRVVRYEQNEFGQITRYTSGAGRVQAYTYEAIGPAVGYVKTIAWDPEGINFVTRYEYDVRGMVLRIELPGGRATRVERNALGQAEVVIFPATDGVEARLVQHFDHMGSPTRLEHPRGDYYDPAVSGPLIVDTFSYDLMGRTVGAEFAANTPTARRWRVELDYAGRPVLEWNELSIITARRWDERGLLLREERAPGTSEEAITSYAYDRAGRLIRAQEPGGRVTEYTRDAWGRPSRIVRPDGSVCTYQWGQREELLELTIEGKPGNGAPARLLRRETFMYDERSRLRSRTLWAFDEAPTAAVPLTTQFVHDADDNLIAVVPPHGPMIRFEYDALGRLVNTADTRGNSRRAKFDAAGDLAQIIVSETSVAGARTHICEYTYDARGRLASMIADGEITELKYDNRNLLVERRERGDVVRQFVHGAHGELLEQLSDPDGLALRSSWKYDACGRTTQYVDASGERTAWDRDALGRWRTMELPDGTKWTSSVTATGRRVVRTTPSGGTIAVDYGDFSTRPIKVTCTAAADEQGVAPHEFEYDGMSRLVRASTGGKAVERRYDSLGRLTEERAFGRTVRIQYDDAAHAVDLVFPDGRRERTTSNSDGLPARVVLATPGVLGGVPGAVLLDIEYEGALRPALFRFGNGIETYLAYDNIGRVVRVEHRRGATIVESSRVRYDERGRRAVVQLGGAPARNTLHTFDRHDRLVQAQWGFPLPELADIRDPAAQSIDIAAAAAAAGAASAGETYMLDPADCRTSQTNFGGAVTAYVIDPGHKVVAAGAEPITYYRNGHRATDSRSHYQVDALGRFVRARDVATKRAQLEIEYDALGRPASGSINGEVFSCSYAGPAVVHEERGPTGGIRQQSPHPHWAIPFRTSIGGEERYLHSDDGLSLLATTDGTGSVRERLRYAPFGLPTVFQADGVTPVAAPICEPVWRGMRYASQSGLYVTQSRIYDPLVGVFLSRDPLLYADSAAPYVFAAHNPVDFADPLGLAKTPLTDAPVQAPSPQAGEDSDLWKWAYGQSGVWFYAPKEGDFWPQTPSFNTGSILENTALNFLAGLGNLVAWTANRLMDGIILKPLLHEVRMKIGFSDTDMDALMSLPVMGLLREEALAEGLAQLARPFLNHFSSWQRFRAAFAADKAIPPIDPRVTRPVGQTAELVADARPSVRGHDVWPSQFPNNQGLDRTYVKAGQTAQSVTRPIVTEVKYIQGYRRGSVEVALKQLKTFGSYQTGVRQGSWRYTYLRSQNLISWPSSTPEMQETGWLLQRNLMNHRRTIVVVNEWLEVEEFDLAFWGMLDDMF